VRPRLKEGDTVDSSPRNLRLGPDRLALVVRTVKYFGLRYKMGATSASEPAIWRSDQQRLDDLHDMFRDPEVKAVFAIRAATVPSACSTASTRLLRANPKIFLGYSDITA